MLMMKMFLLPILVVTVFSVYPVYSQESNMPIENLSDAEKLFGLSLIWKEASYNFAFFGQVPDLDFDSVYKEFIPRVLSSQSTYEYYMVLKRFIALLRDGHTNVYMPKELISNNLDWPAVVITEAAKEAVITGVDTDLLNNIPLGSTIIAADGLDFESHLKTKIMPYISSSTEHMLWNDAVRNALDGFPGSEVTITIKTPKGDIKEISLKRNGKGNKNEKFSLKLPRSNGEIFEFRWIDENIAYIALNGFNDEDLIQKFNLAFKEIQKSKAIIIDLRFNGGGNSNIGAEILSHFTAQDLEGSVWKTRKHVAAYKAWAEYSDEYKDYGDDNVWEGGSMEVITADKNNHHIVPTYVLIGRYTASAAEDFLVYADKLNHFTTIGEKTYGSTGQPIFYTLPGGGSFRICAKRDTYPDGREFVGYGITPDIIVQQTSEIIRSEKDVVLNRAIDNIQKILETEK
jgi:C-terminal processing protease CtpA/Prc